MTYHSIEMTDTTDRETTGRTDSERRTAPADDGTVDGVGTYESGDAVVFYDTENPLAWMQSESTVALKQMM
jgi:hypothetical protein